jgi:predicted AAA+ superfamily ATPase
MNFNRNKNHIIEALKYFPCVVLLGARQVGKTTLSKELLPKARYYDLERESHFQLIKNDPDFFLNQLNGPAILDEAQLLPAIFPALKVFIDEHRKRNGQFIVTGSSSPELLKNITESLAGRAAIFEIEPLAINEKTNTKRSVIFDFFTKNKMPEQLPLRSLNILNSIFNGGYPEILSKKAKNFKSLWFENYTRSYIDRDVRRLFPELQIETYKRFIKMLAVSSGEIINQSQYAASLGVSAPTIKNYLQIAEGTFIFRELLAFSKPSAKRLVKTSKGYIKDSGLLCHFLGIQNKEQLLSHPHLGALFEVHVIEEIIKGLKSFNTPFTYSFYRTSNQVEVDLIIEIGGQLIPIEIKFGKTFRREHLSGLQSFMSDYNAKRGFIINNSTEFLELAPGIFQLPFQYI